jgi:hypothetical protein
MDYEDTFDPISSHTKKPRGFDISGKNSQVSFVVKTLI